MRSYAVAAFALCLALPSAAHAQTFPTHPISMIVPVSAGGAMDTLARIVGQGMGTALGQPVVIENVTGASGSIGVGRVARAAPDGYTLSYAAFATHVVSPATMSLNYDVIADFAPVALISATPWLIAVKKDLPVSDLKGLIAWLKAKSGQGVARHRRRRQPVAHRGGAAAEPHRHALPARAVSRHRAGRAGFGRRPDRHVDPRSGHVFAAASRRPHQGAGGDGEEPHRQRRRRADRGRGGFARPLHRAVAGDLGAEGHAEGDHRQAQRRGGDDAGRSGGARASSPSRATRSAHARSRPRSISAPSTRPRPKSGGRSSRPPASRAADRSRWRSGTARVLRRLSTETNKEIPYENGFTCGGLGGPAVVRSGSRVLGRKFKHAQSGLHRHQCCVGTGPASPVPSRLYGASHPPRSPRFLGPDVPLNG